MQTIQTIITDIVWIITYFLVWPIIHWIKPVKITTDQKVYDLKKPIVIMANHKSIFDPWIISTSLPFKTFCKLLPIRILGTKDYSDPFLKLVGKFGIVSFIYYIYGVIGIRKAWTFEEKTEPLVQAIKHKQSAFIFPEGGLNKDEMIGNFRRGVPYIYAHTGVSILPCSIHFKRGRKTDVNIGAPITIPHKIIDEEDKAGSFYENSCLYLKKKVEQLYQGTTRRLPKPRQLGTSNLGVRKS